MKTRYIGFILALITLFTGCSEEEIMNPEQLEQPAIIKVQACSGDNEASVSRLAYTDSENTGEGVTVTWSANDAFYLRGEVDANNSYAHGEMKIVEKESYGKTEDFKGTLSRTLQKGENVTGYYPSASYDDTNHCFNVDVRKATQNKTAPMAHLSSMNYMVGKGDVNDGGLVTIDFTKGNKVAIVRFDMKLPDNVPSAVAISEFLVESQNLHTIGSLSAVDASFTEDTFFEQHRQKVYLEGYTTSEKQLSVYIAMLPTDLNQKMTVKLTLANGNVYSNTVTFDSKAKVEACNRYYIVKDLNTLIELDYTWYTSLGKDVSNYEIKNENELYALAKIVNGTAPNIPKDDFAGQIITLKNDITLNTDWMPIGVSYDAEGDFCFRGTLDGDNHTISNLKLYVEVSSNIKYTRFYCGFFGKAAGATIKNLILQGDALLDSRNKISSGDYYLGGLLGYGGNNTLIENCRNEMDLKACNLPVLKMGGLVGSYHDSSVKVCSNSGDIVVKSISQPDLGGIVGYGDTDIVVACYTEDVEMQSTKTGSISYLGGIAGRLEYRSTLVASYSLIDEMSSDAKGYSAAKGGLAAHVGNDGSWGNIYGCYAVTSLWNSVKAHNGGNINVGKEVNSEPSMKTLNEGIATWNATLSGVLDPAYCRYVYKQGTDHLVLEKSTNNNTGQLEDMGNGGEIGQQQ